MYIGNSYFPFLETSTRIVGGYKVNVYDVYACLLYPRMTQPSLLHISGVLDTSDGRVLLVSDSSDTHVCDIQLQATDKVYKGIAVDRYGYCGELDLSKEAFDAFNTIPAYSEIDNDSFVFDPTCVIYRPTHNTATAVIDNTPVDRVVFTGDNIESSDDGTVTVVPTESEKRRPVTHINGRPVSNLIITHTPGSSVRVARTAGGEVVIGRMGDL